MLVVARRHTSPPVICGHTTLAILLARATAETLRGLGWRTDYDQSAIWLLSGFPAALISEVSLGDAADAIRCRLAAKLG